MVPAHLFFVAFPRLQYTPSCRLPSQGHAHTPSITLLHRQLPCANLPSCHTLRVSWLRLCFVTVPDRYVPCATVVVSDFNSLISPSPSASTLPAGRGLLFPQDRHVPLGLGSAVSLKACSSSFSSAIDVAVLPAGQVHVVPTYLRWRLADWARDSRMHMISALARILAMP